MSLETFLGPTPGKFCADAVRQVLELAFNEGATDPRDKNHWWLWQQWPLDGRQWIPKGGGSFKLDRSAVAQHEERAQMEGCHGSKLSVERKLEGIIWDHDKPRTELRASGSFDADMFVVFPDDDDDEDEEEDDSMQDSPYYPIHLLLAVVSMFEKRPNWDASVLPLFNYAIRSAEVDVSDRTELEFQLERPFEPFLRHVLRGQLSIWSDEQASIAGIWIYQCTGAFATRDEQNKIRNKEIENENGTPSVSIQASFTYVDPETESERIVYVVAEVPLQGPVPGVFADSLFDRVAGFVFFLDDASFDNIPVSHIQNTVVDGSKNTVRATYVEACNCDYEPMSDSEKDALLEDRALILHRLIERVAKPEAKALLNPLSVQTPPYSSKEAVGLPPARTLHCYNAVWRPDPRWPFVSPNTLCLECGKGPKHVDEEMRVDKLMQCTKCRTRVFCSKECLMKSWKSQTWPHKYECKKACENDLAEVGTSLRQRFREVVQAEDNVNPDAERVFETLIQSSTGDAGAIDRVAGSIEEVHEQREAEWKKKRAAKKKKRKGKKSN